MHRLGIFGTGVFLPSEIRTNDWWPSHIVDQWLGHYNNRVTTAKEQEADLHTQGAGRVVAAMKKLAHDPFLGAKERRVIAPQDRSIDMEIAAARDALQNADLAPTDIDFLMVHSLVPDQLAVPNVYAVHDALGLGDKCLSMAVDASCNSFLHQMRLAQGLVATGDHRRGLLVQSSALSRLIDPKERFSTWFGDGATAVVVGAKSNNRGVVASAHHTNSRFHGAVSATGLGQRWYGDGPTLFQAHNRQLAREIVLLAPDLCVQVLDETLQMAKLHRDEIDFFAIHQANAWFQEVCLLETDMPSVRHVNTFTWAGNLASGNLPLTLHTAKQEGMLSEGDLVALYGGGGGMTWSGMLLRW